MILKRVAKTQTQSCWQTKQKPSLQNWWRESETMTKSSCTNKMESTLRTMTLWASNPKPTNTKRLLTKTSSAEMLLTKSIKELLEVTARMIKNTPFSKRMSKKLLPKRKPGWSQSSKRQRREVMYWASNLQSLIRLMMTFSSRRQRFMRILLMNKRILDTLNRKNQELL